MLSVFSLCRFVLYFGHPGFVYLVSHMCTSVGTPFWCTNLLFEIKPLLEIMLGARHRRWDRQLPPSRTARLSLTPAIRQELRARA